MSRFWGRRLEISGRRLEISGRRLEISGRRLEISGRQKQSSPGGNDGKCWAKMSLQLRIGAQISRKYVRNLFIDIYTINFYSIPH